MLMLATAMGPEKMKINFIDFDDKIATIGISAHAVEALTDLVYMDLPDSGKAIESGEIHVKLESKVNK